MSLAFVAPGTPMRIGPSQYALWRPLRSSTAAADGSSGPYLSDVPGLSGWWDAGTVAALLDQTGLPIPDWNCQAGSLLDKSGSGHSMLPFRTSAPGNLPTATPRLSGLLGGLGLVAGGANTLAPALDPDLGFQVPNIAIDASRPWTLYLVWSRPNWRQNSSSDASPIALLSIGNVIVLQAGAPGDGRLSLFPHTDGAIIKTDLARRHTHAVLLRHTPGDGVEAWIDGTKALATATNSVTQNSNDPMRFLHDGTSNGSAQCWFHEAASWERTLSDTEVDTIWRYASRWKVGVRRGIVLLFTGQSNAINYTLNDSAGLLLAQGVAWHLGALAYNIFAAAGDPGSHTMVSGHGIYTAANGALPASFLVNPEDGSEPSMWTVGPDGEGVATWIRQQAPNDLDDLTAIVWPWSESDSTRSYAEKATFKAAAQRWLAAERAMIPNATPANTPPIWWNAIPYGTDAGIQMHREVSSELASDPSQNVVLGNLQTADSCARGAAWDPLSGSSTGGDNGHRDAADNQRFARLAAPVVARALLAAGRADSISAIPAGIPLRGGPVIVHAYRQTDRSIIITVQHDKGSDLQVPRQAANGIGWTVMDGGSPANPGPLRTAISCSRIDSNRLQITLSSALASPSSECLLFYPYGTNTIGRGNAVTDNYSSQPKPPGWDIGKDLGSAWNLDYPLAATATPIPLSDLP